MRFLKYKIQRAMDAKNKFENESVSSYNEGETAANTAAASPQYHQNPLAFPPPQTELTKQKKKRCRKFDIENPKPRRAPSSTKNISINFGKAIASFAGSHLAIPYLQSHLEQKRFTCLEFLTFVNHGKGIIGSIETFRNMLLVVETDDEKQKALKETFKALAEVFIKYFSVNWITHGKVTHKLVYLKYRHKVLRRVQNPESFTYVKKRAHEKKKRVSK